jgi:Tfp pilus assembly PilM family ATPase
LLNGAVIAEPFNLGRMVRDVFDRRALPRHRVHCAVPTAGALSRVIDIPRASGRDRRRSVIAEAMRALGVSPGRHFVYWQTVDEQSDHTLVFVLAVPRESIRSLVEMVRAAGIRPRSVDAMPLALARAVGQADAIVVGVETSGIDLAIVLDDVPLVMGSTAFGDRALGLDEIHEAAIGVVTTELRRYQDAYVGSRVERSVPIFLGGRLGANVRLADRLRSVTGHPIGRLTPLLDYPEEFPIADYLANIGLVLKEG